jgi:phosphoribosylaminoimidazole (AIR) synthetase
MMMQTFNMGTLLEIYTDPESAAGMIEIAASLGIHAQIIGYTEASEENKLTIEENGYVYKYQK